MKRVFVIVHNSYGLKCVFAKVTDTVAYIRKEFPDYREFKKFEQDSMVAEMFVGNTNPDTIQFISIRDFMNIHGD